MGNHRMRYMTLSLSERDVSGPPLLGPCVSTKTYRYCGSKRPMMYHRVRPRGIRVSFTRDMMILLGVSDRNIVGTEIKCLHNLTKNCILDIKRTVHWYWPRMRPKSKNYTIYINVDYKMGSNIYKSLPT